MINKDRVINAISAPLIQCGIKETMIRHTDKLVLFNRESIDICNEQALYAHSFECLTESKHHMSKLDKIQNRNDVIHKFFVKLFFYTLNLVTILIFTRLKGS